MKETLLVTCLLAMCSLSFADSTTYYNDGSYSNTLGNTTYFSGGGSATQIGDTTYFSDGTTAMTFD